VRSEPSGDGKGGKANEQMSEFKKRFLKMFKRPRRCMGLDDMLMESCFCGSLHECHKGNICEWGGGL